jgi:hypothetical protein
MNPNTWISFLTTTIGAAATASATDGLITGNAAQTIISVAGIAVPYLWGLFIHRDSKVVQTASVITGVEPIRISPEASPQLLALAADRSIPTVQPVGPPFAPSTGASQQQRR